MYYPITIYRRLLSPIVFMCGDISCCLCRQSWHYTAVLCVGVTSQWLAAHTYSRRLYSQRRLICAISFTLSAV